MNILVLGSGGREHAFSKKLSESTLCDKLFIAPGNAGTLDSGKNVNLSNSDFPAIENFCRENAVKLIVVGPEAPLVEGVVDYVLKNMPDVRIIGPGKVAAQLEGSKSFAKEFMQKYNIPTAGYSDYTDKQLKEAISFLRSKKAPFVIKADGLAAGKGVIITSDLQEAQNTVTEILQDKKFGAAGQKVVIEEFLDGIEFSVFTLTDGKNYKILPLAKDYKRIGEGDTGLNTGGMGAVSPVPFVDDALMHKVEENIIKPTIEGIAKENMHYKGFVYFGLINIGGEPLVIEYNVRMGDPETQVVMTRLDEDLVELFMQTAENRLESGFAKALADFCVTVVAASGGYPENYQKGIEITGLDNAQNCIVHHAGTKSEGGKTVTSGGRVLAVTALGKSLDEALNKANAGVENIQFEGIYFRRDIGKDLIKMDM